MDLKPDVEASTRIVSSHAVRLGGASGMMNEYRANNMHKLEYIYIYMYIYIHIHVYTHI